MKLKQKKQSEITVVFEPVAQNTVIRPMAEAVCIVQGGQTVHYTDTADHKEKSISLSDLRGVRLSNTDNQRLDAYDVALKAKQMPICVRVDVNDVHVLISKKTTIKQAMTDFYQKIASRQYE